MVVFAETDSDPAAVLQSVAGLSTVASSRDFDGQGVDVSQTADADATVYAELGIAVVTVGPDELGALQTSSQAQGSIVATAPELIHHVLSTPSDHPSGVTGFEDSDQATWGLQAVDAETSAQSGHGIKVAVLDTGLDATHPDFTGRTITARSFVPGETAQDGHGHGTHCIGTACGAKSPADGRRYGVAYESDIFAGKVLSNQGSGSDSGILAGIDWAVSNGCAVISMSLGAGVAQPHPPYTFAGRRALARGTLIIAAAGNNANRPGDPGFVGAPANSPSIMAVAAVDSDLEIAQFSARSLPRRGGQVDVAGPGVAVYSSWLMPMRYQTISGTSMATPHAAGVAALWAQATGRAGLELWATLAKEGRRLAEPSLDVGSGLVQAPR
ncbi:MAG: S8 family serine peptidase [Actinomycetota bacterium]|nr:S8 family serine peptidase [Actinomycetota bacterium]